MKKVLELKTIQKQNFYNPERFEKKINRLKAFCSKENTKVLKGQRYYVEIYPDHNSATLYLEIDKDKIQDDKY